MDIFSLGALFVRMDETEYREFFDSHTWEAIAASAVQALPGPAEQAELANVPSYTDYRHFFNTMLEAGIPGALPPVESLYKEWGGESGALDGAISGKGFYLGASARHIQALCDQLEVTIPERFQATPDHLALLVELYEFLCTNASAADAQAFASAHLDWLEDYTHQLVQGAQQQKDTRLETTAQFFAAVLSVLNNEVTQQQTRKSA